MKAIAESRLKVGKKYKSLQKCSTNSKMYQGKLIQESYNTSYETHASICNALHLISVSLLLHNNSQATILHSHQQIFSL